MKKKILEHIITGLGIGFIITTICLWAFKLDQASGAEVMRQFTTWLFASALYGLISIIYDTSIPFPFSLAVHFLLCAAVTFVASIVSGIMSYMQWYQWFIYILPVFIGIYILIGLVMTIVTRCDANKINNKINNN